MFFCKVLICSNKRCLSIIIISIDNYKRLFYYLLATQNGLSCSPRLISSFVFISILFRYIIYLLINIIYFYYFFHTISNNLFKVFLNLFTYYKNNLIKSSLKRIIYRIIHNDFSTRAN